MSTKQPMTNETLLKAAREAGIKLPKSKKDSLVKVEEAMEEAGDGAGKKAILKVLKEQCGVKKASGKRKAATADPQEAESKPPAPSVLDEVFDVSNKADRKAHATKLVDVARSRGIKMPEAEDDARRAAFTAFMAIKGEDGTFVVREAVEILESKYKKDPNWVDPDSNAPKKKKKPSTAKQSTCPENAGLADAFDELAGLKFKEKSKSAFVYKKVVGVIKDMDKPLLAPPKAGEYKGVGKGSIAKIAEFLETGTMEELEEMRANSLA